MVPLHKWCFLMVSGALPLVDKLGEFTFYLYFHKFLAVLVLSVDIWIVLGLHEWKSIMLVVSMSVFTSTGRQQKKLLILYR